MKFPPNVNLKTVTWFCIKMCMMYLNKQKKKKKKIVTDYSILLSLKVTLIIEKLMKKKRDYEK